jgi:hypothetical protein
VSWIEKELKRRTKVVETAPSRPLEAPDPSRIISDLWHRVEQANAALPEALRLRLEMVETPPRMGPYVRIWLRAPNGAALGFAGDAIRYSWPERKSSRSRNFWITWNADRERLEISQRVSSSTPPVMRRWRFDTQRIEQLLQGLVTSRHVEPRSLRKRRLWLF